MMAHLPAAGGGGGAVGAALLDPSVHQVGLLREAVGRWLAELDLTRLGSWVALAGLAPAGWRIARAAWHEVYGWVRQFLVASVTIPGSDPLNRNVMAWVLAHVVEPRRQGLRAVTARTRAQAAGGGDVGAVVDRAAGLKKTRREIQWLPHFESVWFWHGGRLFVVRRSLAAWRAALRAGGDATYDGVGGEELEVACLGRSVEPVRELVRACGEYADRQAQYFVIIYARSPYGTAWQPRARKPIRRLDTVHFDDNVKRALLADIRNYLDPATKRRYQRRCMPYRRGYLLYGPPGTGKSSLSTALAGEFGLDLYELKMPSLATDAELELAFQDLPRQCIVLLEDIDAVWAGDRSSPRPATPTPPPMTTTTGGDSSGNGNGNGIDGGGGVMLGPPARSGCTLSGLLNVLDGVGSHEGRIVIMTTNHADRLDGALTRPGRVDMKIFLGNISPKAAEQMFVRMFAPDYVDVDAATTPASAAAAAAETNKAFSSSGHGEKEVGVENHNKSADTGRRVRDTHNGQTSSNSKSPREKGSEKKSDANPTIQPTTTGPLDTADPYGAELAVIRALAARFAAQVPADTFTPSQLQGFFQLHLDSAVEAADHIAAWVARERGTCVEENEENEGLVVVHHPPVVVEGEGRGGGGGGGGGGGMGEVGV